MVYFGLSPDAFLAYAPIEFDRLLSVKADEKYNKYKLDMERMRLQTLYLVNVQIKDKIKEASRLMPFAWDVSTHKNDADNKPMTEEDWEALDKFANITKK